MSTLTLRALRAPQRKGLVWETEFGPEPEELDDIPAQGGRALPAPGPLELWSPPWGKLLAGWGIRGPAPLQARFLSDSCGSWRETGTGRSLIALGSRIPASVCCL